ncbi:MAG TPA: hypothetical protein VNG89_02305, partial [Vicinamibacterales bacterium]|nr:hypothetical protein [Vicinamibacterales bacterium]
AVAANGGSVRHFVCAEAQAETLTKLRGTAARRRQLLLARRRAGTSVVDAQHDDPVSAQGIGDGGE